MTLNPPTFRFAILLLALAAPAHAADVTVTLPAGDGFVIENNTSSTERFRVDEATGNISRNGALFVHTTVLLVRTDPGAKKHKGITCLLVDMSSAGVEVKPLRMMSGDAGFNEIFFTGVRVPKSQVLGEVDGGWSVALTALMNERMNLGGAVRIGMADFLDTLIRKSREIPGTAGGVAADDPLVRQKIAQAHLELEVFRMTSARALSRVARGGVPGPEGSILKLFWSELNQRTTRSAMEIAGPWGQLAEEDWGAISWAYLRSRGNTIEAGTSEILRNIVAQRVLGLPKSY